MKNYLIIIIISLLLIAGYIVFYKKSSQLPKDTMEQNDSGLKYEILQEGTIDAKKPAIGNTISVHYTGWLEENGQKGKKFDSSLDRAEPITFKLGAGQVIKGWDEGILNMKVGEKRRLIIPARLGYGSTGAGGIIPGNATLIFDVELVEIR